MEVDEAEERRGACDRILDRGRRDFHLVEGLVRERVAEHPFALAAAPALLSKGGEHLVQRPHPGEVDPSRALGAVERVQVAVDEAGHERGAGEIDDLGSRPAVLGDLVPVADRHDQTVGDGQRACRRSGGVEGADTRVLDDQAGSSHRFLSGKPGSELTTDELDAFEVGVEKVLQHHASAAGSPVGA